MIYLFTKSSTYNILNINPTILPFCPYEGHFCIFLIGGMWLVPPHHFYGIFPILPPPIFLIIF